MTTTLTDIDLHVRPISQHGMVDVPGPMGNFACWFASASMVLAYRKPLLTTEMLGLRTIMRKVVNRGVQPDRLPELAAELGLEHLPAQQLFPRITVEEWHKALSTLGPLMVVVGMHMVVVHGLRQRDGEWEIVYNDPWTGSAMHKVTWRFDSEVDWRRPILFRRAGARPPLLAAAA